ncbi:MAG: ABC transporter permease [Desulfuromonas sp.]|nr:MAG: ABC transporter permease [Desulfuromonas sp.]
MFSLYAHIRKELLLLSRDRGGLLVLFVMPMLLVLVLSLIQDNLFRATGESASRALFVNNDQGELGARLKEMLEQTGALELVEVTAGQPIDTEQARKLVVSGDYQFAILVPVEFSAQTGQAVRTTINAALNGESPAVAQTGLTLFFDPTVRGVYRSTVINALYRGLLGLEIQLKGESFSQLLPEQLEESIGRELQGYGLTGMPIGLPAVSTDWAGRELIVLKEESAFADRYAAMPTSVQQNVPAWTLFGMFFIVIPLAGTLIRERQEGTLTRLMTMPVGCGSLLLGKVAAYLLVCMVQFALMLAVGRFVLPQLGTPVLELGSAPQTLLLVALASGLAACGYGILVGTLAKSYEQASTFGAVSVVIAAAVGGVMVPVYVMPKVMRALSVVSPLGWGLDAFLDLFVRQGNLSTVWPQLTGLMLFALACLLVAILLFRQRRTRL